MISITLMRNNLNIKYNTEIPKIYRISEQGYFKKSVVPGINNPHGWTKVTVQDSRFLGKMAPKPSESDVS